MSAAVPQVSVIVPTLGRPESLCRALESLLRQTFRHSVEILVVDNDPGQSARAVVARLAEEAPIPLRYVSAPSPGVSNARNAGIAATDGDFIAFLDDDQSAPPTWLGALLAIARRHEADAVFGPVRAELPEQAQRHRAFLRRFFGREGPAQSGLTPEFHGCGNCLVRRAALPHSTAPFCTTRNLIGGEDDLVFSTMQAAGARFAWAAEAEVVEHVPASRARLSYALRRAFSFGQGPASACAAAGPRRWPMIPVWMAIGAGQAIVYGALAIAQLLTRTEAAAALNRMVQGLGKVIWFPPFKFHFYGQVAAATPQSA